MSMFTKVHIYFVPFPCSVFFDQIFGFNRGRAKFGIEFSIFRLKKKLYAKETRCPKCFACWIKFFNISSERTSPVINAKHGLKTFLGYFFLFISLSDESGQNLIIITPLVCFLPDEPNLM